MREQFEYYTVISLLRLSRLFPKRFIYFISKRVVAHSYSPKKKRYERILQHLLIAFPNLDKEQRIEYADRYLEHKSSFYAEILLMLTGRFDYDKSVINLREAKEKIEKLKKKNSNGMIFLVSHYGNWEFLAQFFAINGLPGTLVAKEHKKNPLIDEKIILPYRKKFGHRVIERKGAIRTIAKILKNKEGVGMHIDQMIPPPNGVEIEFFSKPAYASKSMAQLKLKFNPLMVPIFAKRVGREKFYIDILEPVEYRADEVEDNNKKIEALTQKYTNILENKIKEEPFQWEWSYKRWRKPS